MKLSFAKRKRFAGYAFLSPWLFGGAFLLFYPLIFSFALSFSELENNNFLKMTFTGLKNYKQAFVTDIEFVPLFLSVVSNTLFNTPMIVIFSLITAVLLSRSLRGQGFFRAVFFLPVLLGTSFVMAQLQGQNVQEETMQLARGILLPEKIQSYIGPEITGYVADFFNRITNVMWRSGVQIIVLLAGIQSISPSLYEVSKVDGATEWEMFWKITLPMTAPVMLFTIVYTIIVSLTESSPLMDYIISKAFRSGTPEFAFSAAMGWIYFIFILILILFIFLLLRRAVKNAAEK